MTSADVLTSGDDQDGEAKPPAAQAGEDLEAAAAGQAEIVDTRVAGPATWANPASDSSSSSHGAVVTRANAELATVVPKRLVLGAHRDDRGDSDSYAGKTLRLERRKDGTMLLTAVAVVPEHQLWTLEEPHRSQTARGPTWAAGTEAKETNLDALNVWSG